MTGKSRNAVPAAAALALAVAVLVPPAARSSPPGGAPAPHPSRPVPRLTEPTAAPPDDRLRSIVALIDRTRARAAAPGLDDDERDALAEQAWAQADEALEDPLLRERSRRDPDFLQVQSLLLLDDGEAQEALAVLERLAVIAPDAPATHRLLASALMDLGRTAGAIAEYRRALSLDGGGDADTRAHLGYALAVAGFLEAGLAECERAIARDPSGYLGHFIRGWILGESGRRDEERRAYLEALRHERDDADLWALLARSWELAGDAASAREAWREVVRIDPSDEEAVEKAAAAPTLTRERLSD